MSSCVTLGRVLMLLVVSLHNDLSDCKGVTGGLIQNFGGKMHPT
jgi:hypothetical protein